MTRIILSLAALLLVENATAAAPVLDLKNTAIAGTGCAGATVRATAGEILQIRTPGLSLASAQDAQISRMACAIAIPFKLKKNQKLVISGGRVNVALNIKRGAVARTSAEVFTAGTQGVRVAAVDNGPKSQLSILKLDTISTACGEEGILRTNLSQVLTAKSSQSQSRVNGAVLRLQVVKCI